MRVSRPRTLIAPLFVTYCSCGWTSYDTGSQRPLLAAPYLATRSAAPANPLVQAAGIAAPTVRNSSNDWQARKDLENARTSAMSITANGGRFDRNRGVSPERAAYQTMLGTDQALRTAQPGMDTEAMRQNGGLQREGMQQNGANNRSMVQAMLEQQRINQAGQTQGYANRASAQQEQLRGVLTNPGATAQQRQQAQQSLAALAGRAPQADWRVQVTPTTKNADGSSSEGSVIRYNQSTGDVQRVGQEGAGLPSGMTKQVGTSNGKPVFEDASGKRFVAG